MEAVKNLFLPYLNNLFKKDGKKLVEIGIYGLGIGVLLIISAGFIFDKKDSGSTGSNTDLPQPAMKIMSNDDKDDLESRLQEILSQISGTGKVEVMITYYSSKEIIPATDNKNTTSSNQEKDSNGGTRNITGATNESSIVYKESQGGSKEPLILKEMQPAVRGVLVVAEGASSGTVRENLSKAVQVLADVPAHKVQILERKK